MIENKNWKYHLKFNKKVLADGFNNSREGALCTVLPALERCINDPHLERLNFRVFMTKRERNKQLKERSKIINAKLDELKRRRDEHLEERLRSEEEGNLV